MIRGPRRGLGTFRCRCRCSCRWILLLPLLLLLPLVTQLQTCEAAARVPQRNKGSQPRPRPGSGADFDPSHPPFHQAKASISMLAGISSSGSGSRDSSHHHHHHQQQQQQQQQPTAIVPHQQHHGGYLSSSSSSTSKGNVEGSIIRLMSKSYLFLQIFPNGTVSATTQESSIYSVLEQSAVQIGQVYIRGVASRQYLCLNSCGMLYGSRSLTADCILRENIENNWYNTYTSKKYSTDHKALYVAISNTGCPCRLRLKAVTGNDGRPTIVLGSNEKFTQFFPVRNISLPHGMTLTSLTQIGQSWSTRDIPHLEPSMLGCAPRCSKSSSSSSSSSSSNSNNSNNSNSSSSSSSQSKENQSSHVIHKDKSSRRKNKCPCMSNETPAQGGGGNVERCRRPRSCRLDDRKMNKDHGRHSGDHEKTHRKTKHTKEKSRTVDILPTTTTTVSPVYRFSPKDRTFQHNNNNNNNSAHSGYSGHSREGELFHRKTDMDIHKKKTTTTTTTTTTTGRERNEKKQKDRRKMAESTSSAKRSKIIDDPSTTTTKVNIRLRHMYRKIRAHPELLEELTSLTDRE